MLNKTLLKNTIIWIAVWLLVVGIFNLKLKPMGVEYYNSPFLTSLYYLVSGFIGFSLFKIQNKKEVFYNFIKGSLIGLGVLLIPILGGLLINYSDPLTLEQIEYFTNIKIVFPMLTPSVLVSKFFDIFFQQAFIFIFCNFLYNQLRSHNKVIVYFTLCFAAIHLPLLYTHGVKGLLFILPSIPAGFIFSHFILRYKKGLIYSYSVHISFYFVLGIFLRMN